MKPAKFGSYLQPNWDWRAAGNFMFGGTGSALMLLTAMASFPDAPPLPLGLTALAFTGLGLFLVWLEIGRPWRFLNVFKHPQTSWMTREASVAVLLFATALAGVALGQGIITGIAGVLGFLFLYCQARILGAAKGIPTWREPALRPFIIVTGLTEGAAILLLVAFALGAVHDWQILLLAVLLAARTLAWTRYGAALRASQAPAAAQERLRAAGVPFTWIANRLALVLLVIPLLVSARWLVPVGALLALVGGWYIKFVLVARAAYVQGYGLGKLKRGRPTPRKPVRRQGDPWRA